MGCCIYCMCQLVILAGSPREVCEVLTLDVEFELELGRKILLDVFLTGLRKIAKSAKVFPLRIKGISRHRPGCLTGGGNRGNCYKASLHLPAWR